MRSSVDLPQPDGPMSEMNSPAATRRSMPDSASTRPVPPARGEDLVDTRDLDDRRPAPARRGAARIGVHGSGAHRVGPALVAQDERLDPDDQQVDADAQDATT